MSIRTSLELGFEFGVILWSNEFPEGTQLVSSDFCLDCVHPNGDKRLVRLCKKHWEENLKVWAKLNDVELVD